MLPSTRINKVKKVLQKYAKLVTLYLYIPRNNLKQKESGKISPDSLYTCLLVYVLLRLLQPMFIQKLFVFEYFLGHAICDDLAIVHDDGAREQLFYKSHIVRGDEHCDGQIP